MCGIFAWAGKNIKSFDKSKYDILGIYNIERGKDSCGVSYDGEIYPGVDKLKLYSDFMINNKIKPKRFPVVIGHTRQASVGNIVNEENAHPFGFGTTEQGDFEFIGCHNGTLYNKTELAKMFELNVSVTTETETSTGVTTYKTRQKIDSEILLESIYISGNYKVLSKYNGAAALVFTNTNEPNIIYVWKGASRNYDYSTAKVEEERPLFYYKQSKNSLYISSIEKSLIAIGGTVDKNVFSFEQNTVYKITDGDIENAEKLLVSRANATQKDDSYSYYSSSNSKRRNNFNFTDFDNDDRDPRAFDYRNYTEDAFKDTPLEGSCTNAYFEKNKNMTPSNQSSNTFFFNIYQEKPPVSQNFYGQRIYFNKFRYWRNGHTITGIYTWIPCHGFYFLSEESTVNALKILDDLRGLPFIDGDFIRNTEGLDLEHPEVKKFIPFKKDSNSNKGLHYFIQGVKLINALDYAVTYKKYHETFIKKGIQINYHELSHMSNHPVIDMSVTFKGRDFQGVYQNGEIIKSDKICPLLSERLYSIEEGNVIKHSLLPNNIVVGLSYHEHYKSVKNKEDLINLTIDKEESKVIALLEHNKKIESDDELVILDQLIDESLTEISVEVDELIKSVDTYLISDDIKKKKIENLRILQDWIEVVNTD